MLVAENSMAVPLVRNQAARLLQRNAAADAIPNNLASELISRAPNWRMKLRENPEDSLSWVELSRIQLCNGHINHAKKSMDIALSISPNNRHILRSAARLYFQARDFDKSYDLIRNNVITPSDPWLMAAEVALAGYAGRSPFFLKIGLRLLDDETYLPSQISELAAAIGTEVLKSGGNRRGRNLIRQSLGIPTVNAVAQAEWISRQLREELVQEAQITTLPGAWEALTVHSFAKGRFEGSLTQAQMWIESEEYNIQAYASAAAVANVLDRFEDSLKFVEKAFRVGLIDDQTRNAFSFAHASLGNLEVADLSARAIPETAGLQYYVARANRGLIAFRRGQIVVAKEEYSAALAGLRKLANKELEASALLYLAYELRRVGQIEKSQRKLREFDEVKKTVKLANVDALGDRMTAKIAEINQRDG